MEVHMFSIRVEYRTIGKEIKKKSVADKDGLDVFDLQGQIIVYLGRDDRRSWNAV